MTSSPAPRAPGLLERCADLNGAVIDLHLEMKDARRPPHLRRSVAAARAALDDIAAQRGVRLAPPPDTPKATAAFWVQSAMVHSGAILRHAAAREWLMLDGLMQPLANCIGGIERRVGP